MEVSGNTLEAVQYAVRFELGYSSTSYKGRKADEAAELALAYIVHTDGMNNTDQIAKSGMTYERWLKKRTEKHVRSSVGFIWTILLSGLISAVVRLIVEWWLSRPMQEK